jgi:hypothetical protein
MGQCAVICSKGQKYPSEIDVEQLSKGMKTKDQIITQYSNSTFFPKVVYLQKQIKKHLYKTKRLKKIQNVEGNLTKIKTCEESNACTIIKNENASSVTNKALPNNTNTSLVNINHNNNNTNSNSNNLTTNMSINTTSNNNNKINTNNNLNTNISINYSNNNINNNVLQTSSHVNNNNNNNSNNNIINISSASNPQMQQSDNIFVPPSCVIFIPSVLAFFKDSPIFTSNPFDTINNITKIENDPRESPCDGITRTYPLIKEGDFSYKGQWKDGKRNGEGIMAYKTANKVYSTFKNNQIDGFTKIINEENDVYQGYFTNGYANGHGIIKSSKDASYEGNWLSNNQHGFGYEKWPKGGGYEGEYIEGKKDGIGILSFVQGGSYEGEFENNEMSGIGVFSFVDGRKYVGYWKNNKMDGYGVITWPDGKLFEGLFKDDRKDGFGVYYAIRKIYLGIWKNSLLEGDAIIIEGNKIKKQYWENGRPIRNLPQSTSIFFEKYLNDIMTYQNEFIDLKK